MFYIERLQKAENREALLDFRGSELTWTTAGKALQLGEKRLF